MSPSQLPQRIVMATDFSELADRAAEVAIELAELAGARLGWVHAMEIPSQSRALFGEADTSSPVDRARRRAGQILEEWRERAVGEGLESDATRLEGSPGSEIVRFAREQEADLIVVGSHGHTGLRLALVGSVAERIARDAHCSVLVVRGSRDLAEAGGIVLGDDLTTASGPARTMAGALSAALAVPLHVVHALELGIPYFSTVEVAVPDQLVSDVYADARRQLDELTAEEHEVSVASQEISGERPAAAICDAARKLEDPLCVVGSRGLHGVQRLLLGSTATKVLRHAPGSVLIVR